MTTSYPDALDTFSNPSSLNPLSAVPHAAQHANANDAIEAIQAELGTNVGDKIGAFMYWVPLNEVYQVGGLPGSSTTAAIDTTATITSLPTGHVVKAVTGTIIIDGTTAATTNSVRIRNYTADAGEGQGAVVYASVANMRFGAGFTVETGGTEGRQIRYAVHRASGTVTYWVMVNGYWRIA